LQLAGTGVHAAGYQHGLAADPDGKPLEISVWYPSPSRVQPVTMGPTTMNVAMNGVAQGKALPLVVISHGHASSSLSHYDTAIALADAGFVVAAVSHAGDNYADQSRSADVMDRPRQISRVIDHMLSAWQGHALIDPTRVGMYGCQPFVMDKFVLRQQVLERLAEDLLQAEQAVRAAHEAATHEENIAENKYDTLGLEAAYLATGQARRAEAIRQAMARWRQFRPSPYDASKGIQLGALVCLVDSDDKQQQLFLGPDGGSMRLFSGAQLVQVISIEAPLGRAMLGKCEGDEVSIQVASIRQQFEVLRVQ
jgi:transcription elongation GreA/GreB family factor